MIGEEKERLEYLKLAVSASASHPNKPGAEAIGDWVVRTARVFQAYVTGCTVLQFDKALTPDEVEIFHQKWAEEYKNK